MEKNINEKVAEILKTIINSYSSLNEFAQKADISSAYISKLINLKYKNPPSPNILKKIANASKGTIDYNELMHLCGYFTGKVDNSLLNSMQYVPIPIFSDIEEFENYKALLEEYHDDNILIDAFHHTYFKIKLIDDAKNYFAYKIQDDSMLPLVGIGDIAIAKKTSTYEDNETYLFLLDDNILIRKINELKNCIELQTVFSFIEPIKVLKNELEERNFKVLGKVIKVENESYFK